MKDIITINEAARLWGIAPTRIAKLCREGRIEGARKEKKAWLIPADAQRPADGRIKSGAYIKKNTKESKAPLLPLPVGISDYRKASSEYYYIDKTLMIRDFLDEVPMVSLFTRPRRFGKTLNMDMLRTFFEKTNDDTSVYFQDKKIWACGQKYRDYQGKYPVIFITFKDVKCKTWDETYDLISKLISLEYKRHEELSGQASNPDIDFYKRIISDKASENDYSVDFDGSIESIPGIIGANDIMIYRPLLRAAEDAAYALNCFTDTPM